MNWNQIASLPELETAIKSSEETAVMFFKHSTRCSISSAALSKLERYWELETEKIVIPYFIDLIRYRQISDAIAQHTSIEHESPQVIILHKGKILYQATHNGILYQELKESLSFEN